MTGEPLFSALEPVRERHRLVTTPSSWTTSERLGDVFEARRTLVREDVPRLLAALDAVLKLHERLPVYGLAADEQFPDHCPHGPDYDGDAHFEDPGDGEWLCKSLPGGAVCAACIDEGGMREEWPCPTVQAITRELAGETGHGC